MGETSTPIDLVQGFCDSLSETMANMVKELGGNKSNPKQEAWWKPKYGGQKRGSESSDLLVLFSS